MKTCQSCNIPKATSDFYKDSRCQDGFKGKCKECYLKERAAYAKTESAKQKISKRNKSPERREWRKSWSKGPVGRSIQARERKSDAFKARMKRYYLKNKGTDKINARAAIGYDISKGKIPPAKEVQCHKCPKQAEHYHHHLGYSKEHRRHVIPLCAE